MKPIKIAQLACFRGNIGDMANVNGTRAMLQKNMGQELQFSNIEYLDYELNPNYNKKKYDPDFVELVNKHDVLLIGGGGFFELAHDHTSNGTSMDLPVEILKQITIPIVFYALGFDTMYGITPTRKEKFHTYLAYLSSQKNILISVRNDGSKQRLQELFPNASFIDSIEVIPDGGFFLQTNNFEHLEVEKTGFKIAMNITGDMLSLRIKNRDKFLDDLAKIFNELFLAYDDISLTLIPHIPEDLLVITDLVMKIGAPFYRKKVAIAGYIHQKTSEKYLFNIYKNCDLAIGMRFHANVCALGQGVPTIAIATHQKIKGLYNEINMPERCFQLDKNFCQNIKAAIIDTYKNKSTISKAVQQLRPHLAKTLTSFHRKIKTLITEKGGG